MELEPIVEYSDFELIQALAIVNHYRLPQHNKIVRS